MDDEKLQQALDELRADAEAGLIGWDEFCERLTQILDDDLAAWRELN